MKQDLSRVAEHADIAATPTGRDMFGETVMRATVHKYDAAQVAAAGLALDGSADLSSLDPVETIECAPFNLLMYGGASNLWECLIGNGTATAAQNLTYFNNGNAYLGVGNSVTAAAATQTDLQGASKNRQGQEATYPTHTDGVTSGSEDIVFKSQWGTADGNFAWEEWALFNASTAGRMLQRKVESLGTKTSAAIWTLTVTLSLA